MRYWKRLIKIPDGTDCYYCISNITCPIHVYYCSILLVMLPIYLVTLPDTRYTSCGDTLFMYTYTLHSIYSVSCIPCKHCYCIITISQYSYSACFISTCSYSLRHHYATVIIRLNQKYKIIKTCYMLLIYTDVIKNN